MPGSGSAQRSLAIVGGTYVEKCHWPYWSEIFGSGLRAACALTGRGAPVVLHTYAADKQRAYVDGIGASLGFTAKADFSPGTVTFEYLHSLARPSFFVSDKQVYDLTPLHVDGESILAFGMIEGNPVVEGDRVVFDPQASEDAVPFEQNKSRAKHLAIVANGVEARKLSNENDLEVAGNKLLENAEVVVVKTGPAGALVFTGGRMHHVPSYRTERAFLIGSGDIFSATFAYAWAVQREAPEAAAHIASLATAYYCQTATVPLPTALPSGFHKGAIPAGRKPYIYLAGPFFSPHQLWLVEEARSCLRELGADVFSPYHDVGLGSSEIVAQADLDALKQCSAVLALLDGFDPGTVFEVGFAQAIWIPVTAFVSSKEQTNLTMFSGSGCKVVHDFASAIYTAVWI
jgi:hypothetical protein